MNSLDSKTSSLRLIHSDKGLKLKTLVLKSFPAAANLPMDLVVDNLLLISVSLHYTLKVPIATGTAGIQERQAV